MIQHISAVTFAVRAMPEAITFYTQLGFALVYGSPQARFSTLQAGEAFVNLTLAPNFKPTWWGRTIFRVDNVDTLYRTARWCTSSLRVNTRGLPDDRHKDKKA